MQSTILTDIVGCGLKERRSVAGSPSPARCVCMCVCVCVCVYKRIVQWISGMDEHFEQRFVTCPITFLVGFTHKEILSTEKVSIATLYHMVCFFSTSRETNGFIQNKAFWNIHFRGYSFVIVGWLNP